MDEDHHPLYVTLVFSVRDTRRSGTTISRQDCAAASSLSWNSAVVSCWRRRGCESAGKRRQNALEKEREREVERGREKRREKNSTVNVMSNVNSYYSFCIVWPTAKWCVLTTRRQATFILTKHSSTLGAQTHLRKLTRGLNSSQVT